MTPITLHTAAVFAHWPSIGGIDTSGQIPVTIGVIQKIFFHTVTLHTIKTTQSENILAEVKWLQNHPYRSTFAEGIIVSSTVYCNDNFARYIPIARIAGHCAVVNTSLKFDYGEDIVCVAVPLSKNVLV